MFIGACGLSIPHLGEGERSDGGALWTEVGNKANLAWTPPSRGLSSRLPPGKEAIE